MNSTLRHIVIGLVLLYSLVLLFHLALAPQSHFWDFRTYYYAAKTFLSGGNPYDPESLAILAEGPVPFKYVYPPLTLALFVPFSYFSYPAAATLFLLLKAIALGFLIMIWRMKFVSTVHPILFSLVCLLGFNATIYRDFAAGNISLFEQLLLWIAFSFYLQQRWTLFSVFIVAASLPKLSPVLFLLLLCLTDDRIRIMRLLVSLAVLALFAAAPVMMNPTLFEGFLQNVFATGGRGTVNPSTLAFITHIFQYISRHTGFILPGAAAIGVYVLVVIIVLVSARPALVNLKRAGTSQSMQWVVFLSCIVYALVMPRFKDYSYILLLPPALSLITRVSPVPTFMFVIVILILSLHIPLPGLSFSSGFLAYVPLFLAYGIFFLVIKEFRGTTQA